MLRPRIYVATRLPSIEIRLVPVGPPAAGVAGYANGTSTDKNHLKNRTTWPVSSAIPAALGIPAKSMNELKSLSMQEQQAFHRAALARLRACLGMGWAKDADCPPSSGVTQEFTLSEHTVQTSPSDRSHVTRYRLGSRASRLKQSLHLAHLLLTGPSPSSKAEPSLAPRLARCALYTRLISAFCGAGYAQVGLELLNRQKGEGLEVNPRDVSMVLKGMVEGVTTAGGGGGGGGGVGGATRVGEGVARGGMAVLEEIVPLLPEGLDTVLLTQVVRVMVAHTQCGPDEVKDIITRCLLATGDNPFPSDDTPQEQDKLSAQSKGAKRADMEQWDWGLWDVYLSSFKGSKGHGWKGAMGVLGRFCRMITAEKQRRFERRQSDGVTERIEAIWTEHEIELIQRPFITVMSLFVHSCTASRDARVSRRDSLVPRQLLDDYLALVHVPEEGRHGAESEGYETVVSLALANVWMNAERIVGHRGTVEQILGWISGMTVAGVDTDRRANADLLGLPALARTDQVWQPDSSTYQTLFKELAQTNRYPSPRLIRRFLDTQHAITTSSLNAALSSLLHFTPSYPIIRGGQGQGHGRAPLSQHHQDQARERLGLAWQLLRAFSTLAHRHATAASAGALPEHEWRIAERTVDIVGAGLIKLWRAGVPVFADDERGKIPESPAALQARRQARDGVLRSHESKLRSMGGGKSGGDGMGVRTGEDGLPLCVSAAEWELVSDELHRIRRVSSSVSSSTAPAQRDDGGDGDSERGPELLTSRPHAPQRIDLPLRRPTARMHQQADITPTDSPSDRARLPSKDGTSVPVITPIADTALSILYAQPSSALRKAQAMQKPLMYLIARTLQSSSDARGDSTGEMSMSERQGEGTTDGSVSGGLELEGKAKGASREGWYERRMRVEMAWLDARMGLGDDDAR